MKKHLVIFQRFKNIILALPKTRQFILGIETSCDDTGAAIVDLNGNLISEHVESQTLVSSSAGGIIPTVAQQLHQVNITPTVEKVMNDSGITFSDLAAVAVTVKPGLPLSLAIGKQFAIQKANEFRLPIIPIHHMEAHALTARMFDSSINFPFMVLLISGGNCFLAVAHDVEEYSLIGSRCDISPGDCLDKIARRLRLIGVEGSHTNVSGGRAIEIVAQTNDKDLIDIVNVRPKSRDCNFSFTGIQSFVYSYANKAESRGDSLDLPRICASVQYSIAWQICRKLQRAMLYCWRNMESQPTSLIVSGGVASNLYFRNCIDIVCREFDYRLICPPVKYCTDNGAMIAWNGFELYRLKKRIITNLDTIDFSGRAPFGTDIRKDVAMKTICLSKLKLNKIK